MSAFSGSLYSILDDERLNGRSDFFAALGAGIDASWASRIGTIVPSNTETESYKWLGMPPQMQLWQGEPQGKELPAFAYSLTNQMYEATLKVNKMDLRRDKLGQIRQRIGGLGGRVAMHWEKLLSLAIIAAESSLAYDGVSFFGGTHAESGSNQTNDLTATEVPSANVSTATAPTAEEMADIIVETIGHMHGLVDNEGEPVNSNARNFTLMVGTANLAAAALMATTQNNLAQGETNPVLGLRAGGANLSVIHNPRLAAKTTHLYFFATDTTNSMGPFVLQDELPVGISEDDPGPRSKDIFVIANASRAVGYGLWQKASLVTLS